MAWASAERRNRTASPRGPKLVNLCCLGLHCPLCVLPGRKLSQVHSSMPQLNLRFALEMFPWSCSCGSGPVGLCVSASACACLSSLLSQLNHNSLHKACLSHMALNIHRPASCNNSNVDFKNSEVGAAVYGRSKHRGRKWLMMGILLLTQCCSCLDWSTRRSSDLSKVAQWESNYTDIWYREPSVSQSAADLHFHPLVHITAAWIKLWHIFTWV